MSDHLRIDADLGRLAEVRRFVREEAEAVHATVDCLDDLVQAIDEASTNVIVHGYRGRPGWLEIGIALEDEQFVVRIEDEAPQFDPTGVPEPDLSVPPMSRRPGGMGVHLMRAATDGLSYRPRPGGGNILTMSRALQRVGQEEVRMALRTSVETVQGSVPVTVVALDGELDSSNFEALVDEVRGLYDGGSRHLLLDLTNLTYLASSGLVALSSIVRIMRGEPPLDPEAGWGALHSLGLDASGDTTQTEVQLVGPQPGVERVLQRTGLDRLFVVHPDRATGIAAF